MRLYGDDLSFLQAGHPALFASDSSFSAFYPDYHKPSDTADKLDAAALERMGRGVLGVVHALERVPARPGRGAALVRRLRAGDRLAVAPRARRREPAAGAVAGLARRRARPRRRGSLQAILAGVLLWRHPVPALWLLLVPHLLLPWRRSWWTVLLALAPAVSLLAIGASAWWREAVNGVWLAPWEIVVAAASRSPSRSSAWARAVAGRGAAAGRRSPRRAAAGGSGAAGVRTLWRYLRPHAGSSPSLCCWRGSRRSWPSSTR